MILIFFFLSNDISIGEIINFFGELSCLFSFSIISFLFRLAVAFFSFKTGFCGIVSFTFFGSFNEKPNFFNSRLLKPAFFKSLRVYFKPKNIV